MLQMKPVLRAGGPASCAPRDGGASWTGHSRGGRSRAGRGGAEFDPSVSPVSSLANTHGSLVSYFSSGSNSKESACDAGDQGSIPGLGSSSGEGNGNPLQYSCLENSMDREAWWATVRGVAKSQT